MVAVSQSRFSAELRYTPGVAIQAQFGSIELYFDLETHLLAVARYHARGAQGLVDREQRWSDYRAVEGRQFAFTTVTYRRGAKISQSTIQQVTVNPKIDPSVFANPGAAPAK